MTIDIDPSSMFDTGTYQITIYYNVPNSDVKVPVKFNVAVSYCNVDVMTPTPIERVNYTIWSDPISVDLEKF